LNPGRLHFDGDDRRIGCLWPGRASHGGQKSGNENASQSVRLAFREVPSPRPRPPA
jgi:hypothetical protein